MDEVTKYDCLEKMGASISDPVIWILYDGTMNEVKSFCHLSFFSVDYSF